MEISDLRITFNLYKHFTVLIKILYLNNFLIKSMKLVKYLSN